MIQMSHRYRIVVTREESAMVAESSILESKESRTHLTGGRREKTAGRHQRHADKSSKRETKPTAHSGTSWSFHWVIFPSREMTGNDLIQGSTDT